MRHLSWITACILGLAAAPFPARGDGAANLSQLSRAGFGADERGIAGQKRKLQAAQQDAKQQEQELKDQIEEALSKGDTETARKLRAQLRELHQTNVQETEEGQAALGRAKDDMGSGFGDNRGKRGFEKGERSGDRGGRRR